MAGTKIVHWTLKGRDGAAYIIQFWTKDDKSNALTFKAVTMAEDKIRNKITQMTGNERFTLNFVKPR